MIDINAQDGKEKAKVKIGCWPALWKLGLFLVVVLNFGKILDLIGGLLGVCK